MSDPVEVFADLYQWTIPTPFPVGPVNVYIARDADGLTLIDCGPRTPQARAALDAGLARLGHSIRDVRRILITHAHADHYGLAASLVDSSGARVLTHPFSRPVLEDYAVERELRLAFYAGILREAGVPGAIVQEANRMRRTVGDYARAVRVDGELNEGDTVTFAGCAWQVLHTPGHSSGVVCFYEPIRRVLLSNDHLLRDISSNAVVEPPPPGAAGRQKSLVEYITQLQRVAAMDIGIAWPGHGDPIEDVRALVRQRIEFHTRRAERIMELVTGGSKTAFQLACILFPKLDPLNFFLAISEVVGHLEMLEVEGRVNSIQRGEEVLWQSISPPSPAVQENDPRS